MELVTPTEALEDRIAVAIMEAHNYFGEAQSQLPQPPSFTVSSEMSPGNFASVDSAGHTMRRLAELLYAPEYIHELYALLNITFSEEALAVIAEAEVARLIEEGGVPARDADIQFSAAIESFSDQELVGAVVHEYQHLVDFHCERYAEYPFVLEAFPVYRQLAYLDLLDKEPSLTHPVNIAIYCSALPWMREHIGQVRPAELTLRFSDPHVCSSVNEVVRTHVQQAINAEHQKSLDRFSVTGEFLMDSADRIAERYRALTDSTEESVLAHIAETYSPAVAKELRSQDLHVLCAFVDDQLARLEALGVR